MITEKNELKTETVFSDDREHRYLLKKDWNKGKRAMVLMLNAGWADLVTMDYTTVFVVNNLHKLGYGGCDILNVFSLITKKLSTKNGVDNLYNNDNLNMIKKCAETADSIVIAWGSIAENNKKVKQVTEQVLDILRPYADKLYTIADEAGKRGYHPLSAAVRLNWTLKSFIITKSKTQSKENNKETDNENSKETDNENSKETGKENNNERKNKDASKNKEQSEETR